MKPRASFSFIGLLDAKGTGMGKRDTLILYDYTNFVMYYAFFTSLMMNILLCSSFKLLTKWKQVTFLIADVV